MLTKEILFISPGARTKQHKVVRSCKHDGDDSADLCRD